MSNLEKAIQIAAIEHAGQVDKAGAPYILHPLRVMMKMDSDTERIVAVLHDAIDDSPLTLGCLLSHGFSMDVVQALGALTRSPNESKMDSAKRLKGNPIALKVKLADIQDNMQLSRLVYITQKDLDRQKLYKEVLEFLLS